MIKYLLVGYLFGIAVSFLKDLLSYTEQENKFEKKHILFNVFWVIYIPVKFALIGLKKIAELFICVQ